MEIRIKALRPGDVVEVTRLSDVADTYPEIELLVSEIHRKGASIRETSTGHSSADVAGMTAMVLAAAQELKKGPPTIVSRENGKLGGRPRTETEMPESEARGIWFDAVNYRTDEDAVNAMPGWTRYMAYGRFKRSGRPKSKS